MNISRFLRKTYKKLYSHYGPQHWWPGDTPFEIAVGAILTQNTNWSNVQKAIVNLKQAGALKARSLHAMPLDCLSNLIRPAGYFNVKAKRLKAFLDFLVACYGGRIENMQREETAVLRERLLNVHGIGEETADSILLYALQRPVFVIDVYTKRILSRHGAMDYHNRYEVFQNCFHRALKTDAALFNEYHALMVKTGKDCCRPKPLCRDCPLF